MNEIDEPIDEKRLRRFSMVQLLVALTLLFVSAPFVEPIKGGGVILSLLFSLVLLSVVLAVATRRGTLTVALVLAIPAIAARWINHLHPNPAPEEIFLVACIALVFFVVLNLLRFVLNASSVDLEVLCASISAYLMLGLIWTMAYWLIALLNPDAFSFNVATDAKQTMEGVNAFYFSFVTLSTLGYGDITPVSGVARMLAAMESMTGLLYVAVLIARLVALYSAPKNS
ncbi:MAG TPA: potassium channel family protein [Chthoniobacterales bacterium]|jgi:hypothetical protein